MKRALQDSQKTYLLFACYCLASSLANIMHYYLYHQNKVAEHVTPHVMLHVTPHVTQVINLFQRSVAQDMSKF